MGDGIPRIPRTDVGNPGQCGLLGPHGRWDPKDPGTDVGNLGQCGLLGPHGRWDPKDPGTDVGNPGQRALLGPHTCTPTSGMVPHPLLCGVQTDSQAPQLSSAGDRTASLTHLPGQGTQTQLQHCHGICIIHAPALHVQHSMSWYMYHTCSSTARSTLNVMVYVSYMLQHCTFNTQCHGICIIHAPALHVQHSMSWYMYHTCIVVCDIHVYSTLAKLVAEEEKKGNPERIHHTRTVQTHKHK